MARAFLFVGLSVLLVHATAHASPAEHNVRAERNGHTARAKRFLKPTAKGRGKTTLNGPGSRPALEALGLILGHIEQQRSSIALPSLTQMVENYHVAMVPTERPHLITALETLQRVHATNGVERIVAELGAARGNRQVEQAMTALSRLASDL